MLSLHLAWTPNALQKAKEAFEESTGKSEDSKGIAMGITYRDLEHNRFWTVSKLDLRQQNARGIEITQCDKKGRDIKKFSATDGKYRHGFWTLNGVLIYDYTLPVSATNVVQQVKVLQRRDFTEPPSQFVLESKKTKRMTTRELLANLRYESLSARQRARYSTELQSRLAFPLANFVVFLIGVPFGVVGQRRSNFLAIVNALVFFFGYFFFAHIMVILGNIGRVPPWIAGWLPNGVFSLVGLWMFRRIR